jgi:hypothetical protein
MDPQTTGCIPILASLTTWSLNVLTSSSSDPLPTDHRILTELLGLVEESRNRSPNSRLEDSASSTVCAVYSHLVVDVNMKWVEVFVCTREVDRESCKGNRYTRGKRLEPRFPRAGLGPSAGRSFYAGP